MEYFSLTLPNGIRCIHKRTKSNVTHCALTIDAGSRDELPGQEGVAHLVEHAIFKGTRRRKAYQINCRLENLGGELNAFTTKEETVIHATTLRGDFRAAADLVADIAFHSTFPQAEVEMEKAVIVDEINSYKDAPNERIWDDFEDMVFAGSPLGHNILGTRQTLMRHNRSTIEDFVGRTYNTDRMVFSSIGNISESRFRAVAERYFGNIPASQRLFQRIRPDVCDRFDVRIKRNTHQGHCLIGARAYDAYDPRRTPLALMINILGGPASNSLLNVALREKQGLSYNIEASYSPMSDAGLTAIYFSCDKERIDQCLDIVHRELKSVMDSPLGERKLSMARKQLAGQLAVSMESNEGTMLAAGHSYLLYNSVDSPKDVLRKVASITAAEIVEVARDVFSNPSILIYQ